MSAKQLARLLAILVSAMAICISCAPKANYEPALQSALAEDTFGVVISDADAETAAEEAEPVFRVEIIRDPAQTPSYVGKRVLIYHTHTYEAYQQTDTAPYKETEKWRTTDGEYNVTAVGKALAASLRALGLTVEHDTTAFEPPVLENAYERSLQMLEQRLASGERYDMYIDLHRDAVASSSTIKRTVEYGGTQMARFMVLVGKGTSGGYAEKPDWEANLALARRITDGLNKQCSALARDVKIKTGRFNQHISNKSVLIECGMNTNTLEEVLAGIPYLAQAVAEALADSAE